MQKLRLIGKVALLVLLALLGSRSWAFAEQVNNSVKDCIEHPDRCEENSVLNKHEKQSKAGGDPVGLDMWDFFRMIFATLFVVVLLYFILKLINKKTMVYKRTQLIENIGGANLGGNRSIQMVKVGNRLLVVGVGENIQLLKEIDDPDEFRQIITEYNDKMEQLVQPSDFVTKVIQRTRKTFAAKEDHSQFKMLLKKQLDELKNERKKFFEGMEQKGKDER
ncbi:flagellar biosynthesis protein FliZ [Bacillus methanolicus]|uniref:flagellar biosynthetic protein FliO n=1 Tax=Bacillus methanolicus TaxID=1471 RepID=UPI002010BB2D|nr:flagellar biosynthetic protein FliO [Bacillus methanolicus]UQD51716.1 flagellar biosynthesis protein FliZ [Bacillus methanolicus]